VSEPPDILVEAMQTGDRLGYHPERAVEEIAHFHQILPKAQASVAEINAGFPAKIDAYINRMKNSRNKPPTPIDYQAEAKRRTDAAAKAQQLADAAGK